MTKSGGVLGYGCGRLVWFIMLLLMPVTAVAAEPAAAPVNGGDEAAAYDPWGDDPWDDKQESAASHQPLADPLEPLNRFFFVVNDKLYVYALNPAATVYAHTLPADIRSCLRSFFRNLLAPVRIVNHLLQGRLADSGVELSRLVINTTIGVGGLVDSASRNFGLAQRHADFGQTLGVYGFGGGFYLHWPVLGPSSLRGTVGMLGDGYVSPVNHLLADEPGVRFALEGWRLVNTISLHLGEYEQITDNAFDPYLAIRDAYWQYRSGQVHGYDSEVAPPGGYSKRAQPTRFAADDD
ncbi:MAG: VacJ family lipoprotein [Desulfurivibrio sp.]|nr:VacJ family lipoprotein [Desulfurivibrio sp.]